MTVTRIVYAGNKCRIYLNGEAAFWLYQSEAARFRLSEGAEVTQELKEEIFHSVLEKRAKLRCMHLLETRDYTEAKLREKLRREEYPPEVEDLALAYVKEYRYLDDERYARHYVEQNILRKGKSRIRLELIQRGADPSVIEEALEEYAETEGDRTGEAISYWLEKKHFTIQDADPKEKERMIRFLAGKGFALTDIREALSLK